MSAEMSWERLLTAQRVVSGGVEPITEQSITGLTPFDEDIEDLLSSSAFRRLQGKTQVHPFPEYDYLRTRLTHTLEVAFVGRTIVAKLDCITTNDGINTKDVEDIVFAACLCHDIGNPPFGHIGEYAIQTWFTRRIDKGTLTELDDDDVHRSDFRYFDGNAQGFRIINRLAGWRDQDAGLQLTCPVVAAFSKYPFSSKFAHEMGAKFGFMKDDAPAANRVFEAVGLIKVREDQYCRHPLAYITEAADDICYLTTDIEDAYRMDLIEFTVAENLLKRIGDVGGLNKNYHKVQESQNYQDRLAHLRSTAVSALRIGVAQCFNENIDAIMRGTFNQSLVDASKYSELARSIRVQCEKTIYVNHKKMLTEAAGYKIIMEIMNLYGDMLISVNRDGLKELDSRRNGIYQLMPIEYKERIARTKDMYQLLLILVDYVSGMTDRYILELYQSLFGTNISLGRMS